MALTVSEKYNYNIGNYTKLGLEVTGDGSTTTYTTGLGTIVGAVQQAIDCDTNGVTNQISWSTNVITWVAAVENGSKVFLEVFGTA